MTNFNERLREERLRLDLNQADFGALGGVTRDAQLNYEKGSRAPDSNYLAALMPHGVDVHYLLSGERVEHAGTGLTPQQTDLLTLIAGLSDDRRDAALLMLKALAQFRE